MVFGVQFEAFVATGMATTIAFLSTGNLLLLLMALPMHLIAYMVSLNEPRMFSLMFLWVKTRSMCRNRFYWKASSYTPFNTGS